MLTRRSFVQLFAAAVALPKALFAQRAALPSCACCHQKFSGKEYIQYKLIGFGVAKDDATKDAPTFGATRTICPACVEHRGVLDVRQYFGMPTPRDLQTELRLQEQTPTPEGLYLPLANQWTLWCASDVVSLETVEALLPAGGGPSDFTVTAKPVSHWKNHEWALVREEQGTQILTGGNKA